MFADGWNHSNLNVRQLLSHWQSQRQQAYWHFRVNLNASGGSPFTGLGPGGISLHHLSVVPRRSESRVPTVGRYYWRGPLEIRLFFTSRQWVETWLLDGYGTGTHWAASFFHPFGALRRRAIRANGWLPARLWAGTLFVTMFFAYFIYSIARFKWFNGEYYYLFILRSIDQF